MHSHIQVAAALAVLFGLGGISRLQAQVVFSGDDIDTAANIVVGVSHGGTLTLSGSGSDVAPTNALVIGQNAGSSGVVTVQGAGAVITDQPSSAADTLLVGESGFGALNIVGAGTVVTSSSTAGIGTAGGSGTVIVSGLNSYWGVYSLDIDRGDLTIVGGATVDNSSIGSDSGSSRPNGFMDVGGVGPSQVYISGSGSSLNSAGTLTLESQSTMIVSANAQVTNGTLVNKGTLSILTLAQVESSNYIQPTGTLNLAFGGTLDPASIQIEGGMAGGDGTLEGDVSVTGGTINAGTAAGGTLIVDGSYDQTGGAIDFYISEGSGGLVESRLDFAGGDPATIENADINFIFESNGAERAFEQEGLGLGNLIDLSGGSLVLQNDTLTFVAAPDAASTAPLCVAGLLALAAFRRRWTAVAAA